jgi:hypothetical protein
MSDYSQLSHQEVVALLVHRTTELELIKAQLAQVKKEEKSLRGFNAYCRGLHVVMNNTSSPTNIHVLDHNGVVASINIVGDIDKVDMPRFNLHHGELDAPPLG